MRKIVVPGELLSEKEIRSDNAYVVSDALFSNVLGIYDDQKGSVIPLEGNWRPRSGDAVVGVIDSVDRKSADVYLNYLSYGLLLTDERSGYKPHVGDIIESIVARIEKRDIPIMERFRLIEGSPKLIKVKASKIPRILGKNNSMIGEIGEITKSRIIVGVNGIIAVSGGLEEEAINAIMIVAKEAHTQGLTDRIKDMLMSRISKFDF